MGAGWWVWQHRGSMVPMLVRLRDAVHQTDGNKCVTMVKCLREGGGQGIGHIHSKQLAGQPTNYISLVSPCLERKCTTVWLWWSERRKQNENILHSTSKLPSSQNKAIWKAGLYQTKQFYDPNPKTTKHTCSHSGTLQCRKVGQVCLVFFWLIIYAAN